MSFDTLKVDELKQVAESFGVDLGDAKNKSEIVAALAEEGVSYDTYKNFAESEKEEVEDLSPAPKKKVAKSNESTVLVKMERKNPTYETFGYIFTTSHPFVAIPETVAQEIFDNEAGFRMATPREVQDYYS
jgi:hypothetical protein